MCSSRLLLRNKFDPRHFHCSGGGEAKKLKKKIRASANCLHGVENVPSSIVWVASHMQEAYNTSLIRI
jgi:hypothetical protein